MRVDNPTIDAQELLAHAAWLQRLAARLVDPSAAEDLVQDTYVAALKSPPDADRPPRPWLAQVLRNLVRNRARGAGRWAARSRRLAAEATTLPTAEDLLTQHEARKLVADLVSKLQEPFRSTVLLCYGQGLAPAQVAREQGIPAGTVRWRLKRGLDDLRGALDARYGNDRQAWSVALAPLAAGAARLAAPAGGALKLGAALAVAAALAIWLGTFLAAPSGPADPVAGETAAPPASRHTARAVPALLAPPPDDPGGGGAQPPGRLAAVAPGAGAGEGAQAAAPPEDVIARVMAPGNAPTQGPPDAPVTVVTFIGYQCPFSASSQSVMAELLAANPKDVRLVVKQLPLPFHEHGMLAAEAALAAHEQGKYWAMQERLFANQKALDPAALEEHARAIGLDLPRFRQALADKHLFAAVEADVQLAREAKLMGTPAFFINGKKLEGALPLAPFTEAVDEALGRPRKPPAASGPPGATPGAAPLPPRPRKPAGERPRTDVPTLDWPPARVAALPDEVLGERLRIPFPTGDAPALGPPRAPVEVVYLNDYDCSGCGTGKPLVDGLRDTYGKHLRLVARPVPSTRQNNPNGPLVAEAAWAAHAQGKFWAMHDKLFSLDLERTRPTLERYAAEIGLDLAAFRAALDDGRYRQKVAEDVELLDQAGLRQRPLFVVNGRRADGRIALVQLVEAALRKAGIKPPPLPPSKVPPGAPILGLTPGQRFHVAAPDETWAAIEKPLAQLLERDLRAVDPGTARVAIDCRSQVCRLRFRPGKTPQAGAALLKQVYKADLLPAGSESRAYLDVGDSFRKPTAEDCLARLRSRRATLLYSLRTDRLKAAPDLPVDRLPEK